MVAQTLEWSHSGDPVYLDIAHRTVRGSANNFFRRAYNGFGVGGQGLEPGATAGTAETTPHKQQRACNIPKTEFRKIFIFCLICLFCEAGNFLIIEVVVVFGLFTAGNIFRSY